MQTIYYPAIGATEWVALELPENHPLKGVEVCVKLIARSHYKILAGNYAAVLERVAGLPESDSAPSEAERHVWRVLDAMHSEIIRECCAGIRPVTVGDLDLSKAAGQELADAVDFIGLLHPVAQLVFARQTPSPLEINLSEP